MIEIRSVLDKAGAADFGKAQIKRTLKFMIPLGAVFVMVGALILVFGDWSDDAFFGILLIVLGVLLPVLFLILMKVSVNKSIKENKVIEANVEQTYAFGDEFITIKENSRLLRSVTEYSYELILKGFETADAVYLYINGMSAMVIKKDCFLSGTADELRYLLFSKLGEKFKPLAGAPMVQRIGPVPTAQAPENATESDLTVPADSPEPVSDKNQESGE